MGALIAPFQGLFPLEHPAISSTLHYHHSVHEDAKDSVVAFNDVTGASYCNTEREVQS